MKSAASKRKSSQASNNVISFGGPYAAVENQTDNRTDNPVEHRLQHIAIAAYFKSEARGFAPGLEIDDWLKAEAELARREVH